MIRQNRAVPILLVLTFAFVLYLGGCFGAEEPETAVEDDAATTPVPTPSPGPVVDPGITPEESEEEPFFHTVEAGEVLPSIACLLYTSPSPRDATLSRMPSSA